MEFELKFAAALKLIPIIGFVIVTTGGVVKYEKPLEVPPLIAVKVQVAETVAT